jgi:hypothetical protein
MALKEEDSLKREVLSRYILSLIDTRVTENRITFEAMIRQYQPSSIKKKLDIVNTISVNTEGQR